MGDVMGLRWGIVVYPDAAELDPAFGLAAHVHGYPAHPGFQSVLAVGNDIVQGLGKVAHGTSGR